jgi:hypothetical protein
MSKTIKKPWPSIKSGSSPFARGIHFLSPAARGFERQRRTDALRFKPFCAEEITKAAIDAGVAPADLRQVGGMYQRLAAEGLMRRSQQAFRRAWGNGTLALGWEVA